jgi:hypothetical protein
MLRMPIRSPVWRTPRLVPCPSTETDHGERGLASLPEMLVGTVVMLAVLAAALAFHQVANRQHDRVEARVAALLQQQSGMERMTRELRQANSIVPVSSRAVDSVTWVAPSGGGDKVERRVRYECEDGTCNRFEGPPGGELTSGPVAVISDVRNSNVFNVLPDLINPNYLSVHVQVNIAGYTNPITLRGGLALPNIARES